MGTTSITDESLNKVELPPGIAHRLAHSLLVFMKKFTAGHARDGIQYSTHNGIDAWRTLMKDQLPMVDDKRNILMTEFM